MEKQQMDEKLQQIFKIQPLQNEVITLRHSTNEYRKLMKRTCVLELRNLVNVEMVIDEVQLEMPKEHQIPTISAELRKSKLEALLKEYSAVEESLKLL